MKRVCDFETRTELLLKALRANLRKTGQQAEDLFLCPDCGSEDVQSPAWVFPNGGEDAGGDGPTDYNWCDNCESESKWMDWYRIDLATGAIHIVQGGDLP